MDVKFTDDIPKIEREGFTRSSKYNEILDAVVERAGKAAKLTVDTQGQASSRASSIKQASEKHDAQVNGRGLFVVATRSEGEEFHVYVKFVEKGTEAYDKEVEAQKKEKAKRAEKANSGETPRPKVRKKQTANA